MGLNNMKQFQRGEAIDDIAYLARSEHRVPTLVALADRSRSRSELCEQTGVSSSTIRRTLGTFEDYNWVYKEGYKYRATQLGEAIASSMEDLIERVDIERKLRNVWHWLPDEVIEITFESNSDITLTVAEPDAPYRPIARFESLLRETNELRFLRPEVALMEPCMDVLLQLIDNEVSITLVDRPNCHEYFFSTYPERSSEMVKRSNFTVLEHDELPPYGIGILDDCVTFSCYKQDSGTVEALIDTDEPALCEWAESTYASFEAEANPPRSETIVE